MLRFLLLNATPLNVRRIVLHIREQLKFIGTSHAMQHKKLKGKSLMASTEASILDALRTGLLSKSVSLLWYIGLNLCDSFDVTLLCFLLFLDAMSGDFESID